MSDSLYDVMIIGGGPAGLSAAQYASRAKMKTLVIDKSATAGALAFASLIENYPGLEKPLTGKELLDIFRSVEGLHLVPPTATSPARSGCRPPARPHRAPP